MPILQLPLLHTSCTIQHIPQKHAMKGLFTHFVIYTILPQLRVSGKNLDKEIHFWLSDYNTDLAVGKHVAYLTPKSFCVTPHQIVWT